MLTRINARQVFWPDQTLSALRLGRLEACEKELADLGGHGLFDAETTDTDAERLFSQSWYSEEEKKPRLHSIEEMRKQVLSQLPAEMGLLSPDEYPLALKLALFGGQMPIFDWEDLPAARSLIRRMWCRAWPEKGNWLVMPRQICMAVLLMLSSEELGSVKETAGRIIETVDNTLYLAGAMPAEMAVKDLAWQLQGTLGENKPALYLRLLKSTFETQVDRNGRLMLVHSGLADPVSFMSGQGSRMIGLDQTNMERLYESLMDVEDPLYDRMLSLIQGLMRQEINGEDTVEDLMLMAKQNASVDEMRQVLGMRIICLPTEEMTDTIREIQARVPRWTSLNMAGVQ